MGREDSTCAISIVNSLLDSNDSDIALTMNELGVKRVWISDDLKPSPEMISFVCSVEMQDLATTLSILLFGEDYEQYRPRKNKPFSTTLNCNEQEAKSEK